MTFFTGHFTGFCPLGDEDHPAVDHGYKPKCVQLAKTTDQINAPILSVWRLELPIGPAQPVGAWSFSPQPVCLGARRMLFVLPYEECEAPHRLDLHGRVRHRQINRGRLVRKKNRRALL
jgi:hypothetical protein